MHISAKVSYGLRAVLDLSLHEGQGYVQSSEIASRQNIPESYLIQLLNLLKKSGLVRSTRGPKGGHELIRRPEEIRVGDVLTALDGPVDLLGKGEIRPESGGSPDVLSSVWMEVEQAINSVLSSVTFADLCKKYRMSQSNVTFRI